MVKSWINAICGAVALLSSLPAASGAAEVKVLSPVSMRGVMTEVGSQFEKAAGHKLVVEFATAGAVASRVQAGEVADVAITSDAQIEAQVNKGRLAGATRSAVARVGVGLFVKQGTTRPAMESAAAFKQTMLSAKAIGYGDPAAGGVSGVHMSRVVSRLGLEELQGKIRLFADSQAVMSAVVRGDVDLGFGLTSDAALVPGVELAAPLPAELQNFTDYSAAVVTGTNQEAAARDFVTFLSSPAAQTVWKSKGFETRTIQ